MILYSLRHSSLLIQHRYGKHTVQYNQLKLFTELSDLDLWETWKLFEHYPDLNKSKAKRNSVSNHQLLPKSSTVTN
jgi:hypothetical protein